MLVVVDSGPLGLLSNPAASGTAQDVQQWARALLRRGHRIVVPEVSDYEVRRELVRAGRADGVRRLDELGAGLGYVPVTSAMWRRAAELWADARRRGRPTAPDHALDGDVLLAAQALGLADEDAEVVVATTNTKHLARYVTAKRWDKLT